MFALCSRQTLENNSECCVGQERGNNFWPQIVSGCALSWFIDLELSAIIPTPSKGGLGAHLREVLGSHLQGVLGSHLSKNGFAVAEAESELRSPYLAAAVAQRELDGATRCEAVVRVVPSAEMAAQHGAESKPEGPASGRPVPK